jgi:hypothetical protein
VEFSQALLYAGLIPGYSFPRMSAVLVKTGYLANRTRVQSRIAETAVFVMENMNSVESISPNGKGWEATVRVRCLHAAVRKRLQERSTCPITGSVGSCPFGHGEKDVPINQADMLATLFAFSSTSIAQFINKHNIDKQDVQDYVHCWRYIGYVIGIDPSNDILEHGFEESLEFLEQFAQLYFDPSDKNSRKLVSNTINGLVGNSQFQRK